MAGTGGLTAIISLACAISGGCFTGAYKLVDKRRVAASLWVATGGLSVLDGALLLWVSTESGMVTQQRMALAVLGGLTGAFALTATGESLRPASGATNPTFEETKMSEQKFAQNSIGTINDNQGIVTQGQIGNNVLMQTAERPFREQEKAFLVGKIVPRNRKVMLRTVPDAGALALADRVQLFLQQNGYDFMREDTLMASGPKGPPRGNIVYVPQDPASPIEIWLGY